MSEDTKPVFDFGDADWVARYVNNGPTRFAPGYDALLRMTTQLMAESAGEDGSVLVLGAGGGNELVHFAGEKPGWSFCAIDPSAQMLAVARGRLAERAGRAEWVEGTIEEAPQGPFDAGCCVMVLHMVDGFEAKRATLEAVRARLKPGARFIMANNCIDLDGPDGALWADRYVTYAAENGVDAETVQKARTMLTSGTRSMQTPEQDMAVLREAGFSDVALIYAGLSWRGWVATNPG